MPFHKVEFPTGSSFKHISSSRVFILERSFSFNHLILTLYHQNAPGKKPRASYLDAVSKFEGYLSSIPLDRSSPFSVTYIRTENKYRHISLATLLMFIITREAQANGAVYLYIQYPVLGALGFYSQFGFYPAPENVKKQYLEALEHMGEIQSAAGSDDLDHLEIKFKYKIRMKRGFSLWRGNVNPALELLTKKLEGTFTFG